MTHSPDDLLGASGILHIDGGSDLSWCRLSSPLVPMIGSADRKASDPTMTQ
jgi:hypothetical protein